MAQHHIIIADDEELLCGTIADLLRADGYNVSVTYDGTGVMPIFEKGRVDLVLLDLMMPKLDGLATLALIKKQSPSTRVIMLTGYGTKDSLERAAELGADGYIEKPLGVETLLRHIRDLLEGSGGAAFHEPPIV